MRVSSSVASSVKFPPRYLRASGYFALRPHLKNVPQVRILVGIDVDEIVADYHKRGLLFLADPAKALEDFQGRLKTDIQKAEYRPDIEAGILSFVEDVVSGKLAIKAHPTKRLHAKIYIFLPTGWCEHIPGRGPEKGRLPRREGPITSLRHLR